MGKINPYLPCKCKIETVQKRFKMKQKLQKITKTLLFCIVIILSSCEKEDNITIQNTEAKNNNISIKYVSGKNIPNIINKLNPDYSSTFKSSSSKSNMITDSFGSISIENILEVIDSLGNKNYSFTLSPKKPKPNSIFNLVISTSNGNKDMAIVEYRMAPNFAQDYYNGTKSISEFTGSILRFPFKDASNLFSKTSGNTCIQNIDEVVNCDEIIVDGGNIISSGGGGGSTTISDTNTYTGGDGGTVTPNYGSGGGGSASWVCNRYGVSHSGPTNCGDGSGTWVIILYRDRHTSKLSNPKSKTSGTSCCDDTFIVGTVGVNLFDLAVSIRDILGFSPRSQESLWLINKATDQQIASISNFLGQNNNSTEAKAFAVEAVNLFMGINDYDTKIKLPSFDPLDSPWLKKAREYAERIEKLKDKVPTYLKEKLDIALDNSFIYALNKTALKINPEAYVQADLYKDSQFKYNGKNAVGILLYEFANGLGKDKRDFYFSDDITQQMIAGNVLNDVKNDFIAKLVEKGLSYSTFVAQGNMMQGGYSFSPDHTTVSDSFNKHVNANWVQFFIGGVSAEYRPSNEAGWIDVILSNGTSRKSLLLHKGNNYDRNGSGNNKPLSTISQYFHFKLKVN
jgi:hypothetical protein